MTSTMTVPDSVQAAESSGMISGAQLGPMAQDIATKIATGQMAAPTDAEGWKQLVEQFTNGGQPVDHPVATVGGPSTSTGGLNGTSTGTQASTAPTGAAAQASDPAGVDAFLNATKAHESSGNYQAFNAAGGAAGAYQYIQSTWSSNARAAGFAQWANGPANAAPPQVQDAVARYNAMQLFNEYHSWKNVAEAWYYPAWAGDPTKQNQVPYPSAGNTLTIGQYGDNIVSRMGGGGGTTPGPASQGQPGAGMGQPGSASAIDFARGQIGSQYVWGGESPGAPGTGTGRFDCSGLTQAAYKSMGINLPRTAQAQYNATTKVGPGEPLQNGDLVFFGQSAGQITHVGIYIGNNQMIDAPNSNAKVRIENFNWGDYVGATRPADHTGISTTTSTPQAGVSSQQTLASYYSTYNQVISAIAAAGVR